MEKIKRLLIKLGKISFYRLAIFWFILGLVFFIAASALFFHIFFAVSEISIEFSFKDIILVFLIGFAAASAPFYASFVFFVMHFIFKNTQAEHFMRNCEKFSKEEKSKFNVVFFIAALYTAAVLAAFSMIISFEAFKLKIFFIFMFIAMLIGIKFMKKYCERRLSFIDKIL